MLVVLTVVVMKLVMTVAMIQARNSPPKFNTCHWKVDKKRPVSVVVLTADVRGDDTGDGSRMVVIKAT